MQCKIDRIDKILPDLLTLNDNDAEILKKETSLKFKELIINLMEMKYNIRYCCNKGCKCHPETTISELLKDEELATFLKKYSCKIYSDKKNVLETIKKIIKESDESITIYDDKNLKKVKNNAK